MKTACCSIGARSPFLRTQQAEGEKDACLTPLYPVQMGANVSEWPYLQIAVPEITQEGAASERQ